MNKLIYILAVILFAVPVFAENSMYNEEDMIDIPDYERYLEYMSDGKYRATNPKMEAYADILIAESISLFFAKEMIGNEISNIYKMSKSDYFVSVFDLGYKYDEGKDTQLSCSDRFINGSYFRELGSEEYFDKISNTRAYPWKNRAMEKAKYVINKSVENKGEESSEDSFFLALAEYASDGFTNLSYIQEKMKRVLARGDKVEDMVLYLENYGLCTVNRNKCYGIASLLTKSIEFKEDNPAEAFNMIRDSGLITYAAFLNGYFNIFNDNFYELVQVSKVNEQSVLNILESSQLGYYIDSPYPRYFKTVYGDESTGDSKTYTPQHCTNNVYYGNVYIFPYNNVTYIVNTTETENKIVKIEVRSPRFFNTDYSKNYDIEVLLRNEIHPAFHEVSTMNTFSYKDNIIYSKEYKKQPQSPLGDVDKLKERRGEKITFEKASTTIGVYAFKGKGLQEEIKNFTAYLQKYSSQQLIENEIYFYNVTVDSKNPVYLASAYFYNNNGVKTETIFLLNSDFKILDKKVALEIDNAVNSNTFYKTIVHKTENSIFVGFIHRDNNIFVVNIVDNKVGSGTFPIYYYESESEKINKMAEYKDFTTNLLEKAGMDCGNVEDGIQQTICNDRLFLTSKAYIEELYKKKMERAEENSYPESVKAQLEEVYKSLEDVLVFNCRENTEFNRCMETILSYEDIFKF